MKSLFFFLTLTASLGCQAEGESYPELRTVNYLDLNQYQGLWREIYRIPNSFEKNCANVTANYTLNPNKTVTVVNTCLNAKTGKLKDVRGTAFVTNPETNASLKVSFVPILQRWGLFGGDYNVLLLGDDYEWAVVGSKDREYLWFLSRTPELNSEIVEAMKKEALSQDFDIERLIKTPRI